MIASAKPLTSITRPSTMYMTPRRLWSADVRYSCHKYGHALILVIHRATAASATITTIEVISGIGSWNGIADQVSLPKIRLMRRLRVRGGCAEAVAAAARGRSQSHRTGLGRQR